MMELNQKKTLFFQKIFDSFPEPAFAVDSNCKILEWNKAMEDFCGIKAEEIIGKTSFEYNNQFHHTCQPLLIESYIKSKKHSNSIYTKEETITINSGQEVNVLSKVSLIYDNSNNLVGGVQTFQNITEHVTAEKMLAEDLLKYSVLFNNSYDAIILYDLNGKILEINKKALNLFQFNQKFFLKLKLSQLFPKREFEHLHIFLDVFHKENVNFDEFYLLKSNKTEFIGEVYANLIELENQEILQLIIRDITEKKHIEEKLASEREMLAVTLAGIGDGVSTLDSEGNIILINRVAEKILEMDYNKVFGKNLFNLIPFYREKSNEQYDPLEVEEIFLRRSTFPPPVSLIKMKKKKKK